MGGYEVMINMIKTIPCKEPSRGRRSKCGFILNQLSNEEETLIYNIKKYGKWNGTQGTPIGELYYITYDHYTYKDDLYIIYELTCRYRYEDFVVIKIGVIKQDEEI